MHRLQSDSDSGCTDDSMDNPPRMKSTVSSSKRRLEERLADVNRLRDEFNELYGKDFPRLQRCMEKLHEIIRTFEEDFRRATKGARDGGVVGGVGLIAGLIFAPFTGGISLAVGAAAAAGGGVYGGLSSSEKKRKMTQISQDIEAELKEFQKIINPISEKIKDINERIEELLKDLEKLERDASDVSKYFASTSQRHNIRIEDMTQLKALLTITMLLIGTLEAIIPGVGLLLDLLSVLENTRALDDIDYLANRPVNELIDESKMTSKAGRFIVGMRKVVRQLQDIMEGIEKAKYEMAHNNKT